MNCVTCHEEIPDTAKVCGYCGTRQPAYAADGFAGDTADSAADDGSTTGAHTIVEEPEAWTSVGGSSPGGLVAKPDGRRRAPDWLILSGAALLILSPWFVWLNERLSSGLRWRTIGRGVGCCEPGLRVGFLFDGLWRPGDFTIGHLVLLLGLAALVTGAVRAPRPGALVVGLVAACVVGLFIHQLDFDYFLDYGGLGTLLALIGSVLVVLGGAGRVVKERDSAFDRR